MSREGTQPSGRETSFHPDDIIVSKTDLRGILTYVNDVFLATAGYSERELLGQPHSVIRHPDMPRCVFKLLWDHVQSGREIFSYVNNMAANGDHYWVFAHVTPCFDHAGVINGYHSVRRVPAEHALAKIRPLYDRLLAEERAHEDRAQGLLASFELLHRIIQDHGHGSYDRMVFALTGVNGQEGDRP